VTQLSSSATRRPSSCSLTCAPQHEATPQSMTKQDAAQVSMVQLIMSWLSNSWLSNSWLSNSWLSNSWLSITQHSLITQTRCISDTHFLDDSDAHSITAKEVPTRLSRGQDGVFVVSVDTLCMDMLHRHEWTDSRCLLDAHMPSHTPDGAVPPA